MQVALVMLILIILLSPFGLILGVAAGVLVAVGAFIAIAHKDWHEFDYGPRLKAFLLGFIGR